MGRCCWSPCTSWVTSRSSSPRPWAFCAPTASTPTPWIFTPRAWTRTGWPRRRRSWSRCRCTPPGAGAGPERPAGYTEASRGCLHLCRHCPIPPVYNGRFFIVPRDIVLGDVRQQVQAGAEHITFGDPDFLNGPRHSLSILRALHEEFPTLTFDITCKIEHILRERPIWPEVSRLGVRFVVS